jgi:hypothetical protein
MSWAWSPWDFSVNVNPELFNRLDRARLPKGFIDPFG